MTGTTDLQQRARRKLAVLERRRRDPRYLRTMGRFVGAGLLTSNQKVTEYAGALHVSDVLWSGELEPRLLELLPALLVKCPAWFVDAGSMPPDLARTVRRLRRNLEPEPFRGIPGAQIHRWLPRVGRKDKVPARLKSFRFKPDDLKLLERLTKHLQASESEVLRQGLRALASRVGT